MRNLFIVLAKVAGLLQIPKLIGYLDQIIQYFFVSVNFTMSLVDFCVLATFSWLLLFRANWLAGRLGLLDDEIPIPDSNSLLNVGLKMMGMYFCIEAIPEFVWYLMAPKGLYQNPPIVTQFWVRILPVVLKLTVGFLLVLKTTKIIEIISRDGKPTETVSA